jgi:hypothetical protein
LYSHLSDYRYPIVMAVHKIAECSVSLEGWPQPSNEEPEELIRYAALMHNSVMTATSTEQWETSCHVNDAFLSGRKWRHIHGFSPSCASAPPFALPFTPVPHSRHFLKSWNVFVPRFLRKIFAYLFKLQPQFFPCLPPLHRILPSGCRAATELTRLNMLGNSTESIIRYFKFMREQQHAPPHQRTRWLNHFHAW